MKRHTILLAACLLGAGALETATSQQTQQPSDRLQSFERFDGQIQVPRRSAVPENRRIVIQNWIIPGGESVDPFPVAGFAIVQLRGGELITVIDGQRTERKEDEFWVIPAGSIMAVETEDDSAVLQTIAVRDSSQP